MWFIMHCEKKVTIFASKYYMTFFSIFIGYKNIWYNSNGEICISVKYISLIVKK